MIDRSTPPPLQPLPMLTLPPETIEHLGNGIDLHILNMGTSDVARLTMVRDGGTCDIADPAALMVMTEAAQESTEALSGAEIADRIDYAGGRLSGRAGDHHYSVELISVARSMPELLPVIEQIMYGARFDEATVQRIAKKHAVARSMALKRVSTVATEATYRSARGANHRSAYYPEPEELEAVTAERVANVYRIYQNSRTHAFLAGRIDEDTLQKIRTFLAKLPKATTSPIIVEPYEPAPPSRIDIEMPDVRQAAVAMSLPTIGREHPDYIALRLAIWGLGGYFGSRLMQNIREEKGLTYGIQASLLGTREGAFMTLSAQCDASYVEQLIEETIREISNLASNPPERDELRRLALSAWAAQAVGVDSALAAGSQYLSQLTVGMPTGYFEKQIAEIQNLTSERIAEVAERYLVVDRLSIAVAK